MAGIINTILTRLQTAGADRAAADLERLGRAQTRLGQSSAGAGRSFAAQAQGLGGLVSAYAGAAATSFALEAAFSALANSARALQTVEGLTSLAAASGIAGKEILNNVQKITKGQLSLVESAQQTNLALSAGFNTSQIEGLSEVALKASRALGRDLGDAYTRVVRGSAKMETELLDELGIYTKIEPATRAYAAAIGKTVSQLSEYERRQAFVNSVIAEGQQKFSSINTTVPTAAEKIEAFGKRIIDLGTQLGSFIAERLAPLADFFTNNLGAAIGAFGVLGSIVLGKTLSVISDKLKSFQNTVDNTAAKISNSLIGLTKASTERVVAAQQAVSSISLASKGTAGGLRPELKALKEIAAQRKLNSQELAKAQTVLEKRIDNLKTIRLTETQAVLAARQDRAATQAGTTARLAANAALTDANKKLQATGVLLRATTTQLQAVTAASATSGAAFAKFASTVVLRSGAAIVAISTLALRMVSLGGFLLSAASIFSILGSAIAKAMGKGDEFSAWLKGLGQTIRGFFTDVATANASKVFTGLVSGSLDNIQQANAQLRGLDTFKFKQRKKLGITIEIEKTKEDLVKEVSKVLTDVSTKSSITLSDAVSSGGFFGSVGAGAGAGALAALWGGAVTAGVGAAAGAIVGGLTYLFSQVGNEAVVASEESMTKVKAVYKNALNKIEIELGAPVAELSTKALAVLEDQYGVSAKLDPVAKAYLMTQQKLVLESAKYQKNIYEIASIIAATGKSADQIVKVFQGFEKLDDGFSSTVRADLSAITDIPIELQIINRDEIQKELDKIISYDPTLNYTGVVDTAAIKADTDALQKLMDDTKGMSFSEAISKRLEALKKKGETASAYLKALSLLTEAEKEALASGEEIARTLNIGQSFSESITAGEGLNAILFRTTDLLMSTSSAIQSGTIDYERFSQATSNIGVALVEAGEGAIVLNNKIEATEEAFKQAIAVKGANALTEEEKTRYVTLLASLGMQLHLAKETTAVELEKLDILKKQENTIKTMSDIDNFIKSVTPKDQSIFGLELDIFKARAKNPAEELAITIEYLKSITNGYSDATEKVSVYRKSLDDIEDSHLKLLLSSATAENAESIAKTIDALEKYSAVLKDNKIAVTDLNKSTVKEYEPVRSAIIRVGGAATNAADAITALGKQALSMATKFMSEAIASYSSLINDLNINMDNLVAEERILKLTFEADMSQITRDIDIIKQEGLIEQLGLQVSLSNAKVDAGTTGPVEGAKDENILQQRILEERRHLLHLEMGNALMAIEARREIAEQERTNALAEIEAQYKLQADKIAADVKHVNALIALYAENINSQQAVNAQLVNGFGEVGNGLLTGLSTVFASGATALQQAVQETWSGASAVGFTAITPPDMSAIKTNFEALATDFTNTANDAQVALINNKLAEIEAEGTRHTRSMELLDAEAEKVGATYDAKFAALDLAGDIEGANAIKRLGDAAKEAAGGADKGAKAIDSLTGRLSSIQSSIDSAVNTAFSSLNSLIMYGEGSAKEIAFAFFRSIQETLFEKLISEPLSNIISNWLTGVIYDMVGGTDIMGSPLSGVVGSIAGGTTEQLNVNTMGQGAFTAGTAMEGLGSTVASSTQLAVNQINTAQQQFAAAMQRFSGGTQTAANTSANKIQSGGQQLTTKVTTTGQTVAQGTVAAGTAVGSAGTTFTSLLQSFWPMLIMMGITALVSKKASGGSIQQFAAGGSPIMAQTLASGGQLRDRVPALLEPGEFVIRRPAARAIGGPALRSMNATGNVPTNSAPIINFKNEGSPKDVEASQPKFDGENYVIDIITRDLSNNGPIRRSLRSGGI